MTNIMSSSTFRFNVTSVACLNWSVRLIKVAIYTFNYCQLHPPFLFENQRKVKNYAPLGVASIRNDRFKKGGLGINIGTYNSERLRTIRWPG